ncbi:TPA: hypothetical protein ACH3X3_000645 [Trebouxia sp. C0006]
MAMLGFRSISQILCVLACALHHQVVIASPAEATPEPTFPTGWYANPYAPGPATGQDTFWHSLEVGDAPAAVEVIEANIAPASAPPLDSKGSEPYGAKLISDIVTQAATDLTQSTGATGNDAGREKPINQPLFDSTFDSFLAALKTAHATQASVIQGFAEAIYESMYDQTFSGELGPDLRPSLLQLAHAAGLDQAMTAGFILARNNSLTVLDAISALKTLSGTNVSIDTAVIGIAHSAAINAFGITPANVQLSNVQCCNLSSIANLMFGSAYLGVDDPLAAAQHLSSAVLSIHLPPATQQEAFVQAINQTLYQAQPEAAAVLLAAALSANETAAVSQGFALATTAPLQVLCASQSFSQTISMAAGLAASSAISPALGSDPCKLFQGSAGSLYQFNRTSDYTWKEFEGANTACDGTSFYGRGEAQPSKSDCERAISQVQSNGSTACVAPQPNVPLALETSNFTPLVTVGTCQLALGGAVGNCLPTSQVAEYATDLANACANLQMTTGDSLIPSQNESYKDTYVRLSQPSS